MRLKGKKLDVKNVEYIIIPRTLDTGEHADIILKAQAILSFEDFDKMCPVPEPAQMLKPGGVYEIMTDHPEYLEKIKKHNERRMQYMVLKSLEATVDLEWDTVKISDPTTWDNLDKELEDAGFSAIEVGRIRLGVMTANAMTEERMDEARDRFLATLRPQGQVG